MINRYNACAYNTSVMPRKIYCTYFYIFNIFTYTKCANRSVPLARRCQGKRAGRGQRDPRLFASQIVIYRKWPERIQPNPSPRLFSPSWRKIFYTVTSTAIPFVRDTCRHFRHSSAINARNTQKKCSESGTGWQIVREIQTKIGPGI